ncbi:MAG: T9SS type A sorting domain-containing protein [Candidatus Marinimicrobia bacterium]|nr:T9SS type A sorting domain-containing protein [Candidatus Neomarinimicrobiota bacterium]
MIHTERTKVIAASKAGMDVKTARKYLGSDIPPSELKKPHTWRTRKDPFAEDWPEISSNPVFLTAPEKGSRGGNNLSDQSLSGSLKDRSSQTNTDSPRSATWLQPYIVGDTLQITSDQYSDTLYWYTHLNLPGMDLDSVTLALNPSDLWQPGIGDTIIFALDNNYSPVVAITPISEEQRDDITVNLNLTDAENDLSDLLCEYKQEFAAIWQTATLTGDTTDLTPGSHQLIWHSAIDLHNYVGNALFRVRPRDADWGEYTSILIPIDQVGAPEVALTLDVTAELSGDIVVDFAISDDEGDSVALEVYFSLDDGSNWNLASTTLTDPLDSLSYEGQLTWLSYTDAPGVDVNAARVKLVPFDGNYGPEQISDAFQRDNNLIPSLTLVESNDFWGGDVGITYNISDAEGDSVDLICQYLDADDIWQTATILEQLSGIDQSNYSGTLTWVSASDLPALADTILFAVTPADTDPGEADTMVVLLDNIPPAITVADISNEIYGDVTIQYSISNDGLTAVGLNCEYSTDGGGNWLPATNITGNLLNIAAVNYTDSLVWQSDQILTGQDLFSTRFRITPFDSVNTLGVTTAMVAGGGAVTGLGHSRSNLSDKRQKTIQTKSGGFTAAVQSTVNLTPDEVPGREASVRYGTPDETEDFHLDNNLVPTIQLTATGLWYSTAVPIPYAISDAESDDINYNAFYHYSDSWIATTAIIPSSPIAAANYNDQLSWNSLSDLPGFSGTLDFAVTVNDADEGFHDTIAVQIDRDNPISGTVSDGGFADIDWSNDSTTIAAVWSGFSDQLSGIASYHYSIGTSAGDSGIVDWQDNSLAESMSSTGLQLSNGITYFVNVRCYDRAGNWVEVSSNGVTIDLFEPTIGAPVDGSLAEDLDWQTAIDSLHIYWTGNDTREMAYYEYCVGTASADSNLIAWTYVGSGTYAHIGDLSLSEGTTYYASVRAYDLAGNRSLVATSDGINVDITPPTAGNLYDGLSDDLEYSESLTSIGLNWDSFSDDQSGISGYYYQLGSTGGGDEIKTATYTTNMDTVTVTGLSLVHGQTYYASIRAVDLVGHSSDMVTSNGFTVDIFPGPPTITTVTPQHTVDDAAAWFDLTTMDSIVVEFSEPVRTWSMDLTSVVLGYVPWTSYQLTPDSSRLVFYLDSNLPSADSLHLTFGDLTDFAGRNGGNYDYDFYTTMLGDFNRDRNIDVNDISALLNGWSSVNYSYELAPVTGIVPHLVSTPNQDYDLHDLMTFVRMWNWQHVDQTPVLAKLDISGLEPIIRQQGNLLILELPEDVQSGRFYLEYDQTQATFDYNAVTTLDKIQLKQENKLSGQLLIECGVLATAGDKTIVLNTASLSRNNPRFTLTYELFDDRAQLKGQGTAEKELIAIPQDFALRQNYPNPFNPITTIDYDLPEDGNLKLAIYDILGREVIELANGYQKAGYKSIRWNGRNKSGQLVSAGMYFYAIEAGKYSAIRKMILLK